MVLRGKYILLVEDEYFIVQDMMRAFHDAGAIAMAASTVSTALQTIVANKDLDGAVLDINLQGEMVYSVADALMTRHIPFVFATGYDREEIPARFANFIRCEKPVSPDRVARALFPPKLV